MWSKAPGQGWLLQTHRGVRGRGNEVSQESRSIPSVQTPSTPTEYKSSCVSACATLMCCMITAGPGKECVLTQERCLLNTAVGKLLRNHPQTRRSFQRCSLQQFRFAPATTPWLPIMFFSPRNEILPIHNNFIRAFTYSELCFCLFWAQCVRQGRLTRRHYDWVQLQLGQRWVLCLGVNRLGKPLHTNLQPAGEITGMLLPFMAWKRNIQGGK